MNDEAFADLAVRVARAEIERDAALERERQTWSITRAIRNRDPETMLDELHIMGIPARDLKAIFEIEDTWRREGGNQSMIDWWKKHTDG